MKSALLLVSLLAPPVAPQSEPCIDPEPRILPWPGGISMPDVAGLDLAAVGDFDGNLAGDVVWVIDGTAMLALKPAIYDEVTVPVQDAGGPLELVTGLAVCPASQVGQEDRFYAASPAGLERWSYQGIAGGVPHFTSASIETSLWVGATHLHHADLDGVGSADVVGIRAAKDRILVVRHDGTGFSSTQQITVPLGEIWDVAAVDWLGTGLDCIAVLAEGGLAVVNPTLPTPQLVKLYEGVTVAGVIAALELPNGNEAIAWARRSSPTTDAHLVLRGPGDLSTGPIWLDLETCANPSVPVNVMPFAIEACDYDGVQGDEVVLALPGTASPAIAVLHNQLAPPFFSTSSVGHYDMAAVSGAYGFPGIGQLDDGPEDLAIPLESGDLEILTGMPYVYAIEDGPPTSPDVLIPGSEWGHPSGSLGALEGRQLHMAFHVPAEYADWATRLEVILWHLDDLAYGKVEEQVSLETHVLVDPTAVADQFVVVDQMAGGLEWPNPQHHYFVELRFLEDHGNGPIQASKSFTAAFTLCTDASAPAYAFAQYFEPGLDDLFIAGLVGSSYVYDSAFLIANTSQLLHPGTNPPGAMHGFFFPSVRPPIDPGNIPDPVMPEPGPPAAVIPNQD